MQNTTQKTSIGEVAEKMKTTPLNVLMHIKRGLLQGVEIDGHWWVENNSLALLLAQDSELKSHEVCASGCAGQHACSGGCS